MEIIYSHSKITDFIENLNADIAFRVYNTIDMLEIEGNNLRMPHSKALGKGLFELRVIGSTHIRIIYVYHNGQALLLNIFFKKTWLIPKKEIEYAQNILIKFLA